AQGPGAAGRDRLCGRRLAVDHRSLRGVQERAQSQRRAVTPELPVQRRGAAAPRRWLCASLVPCTRERETGTDAALCGQVAQGRSRRGARTKRGDQGALRQDFRGLTVIAPYEWFRPPVPGRLTVAGIQFVARRDNLASVVSPS